MLDVLLTGSVSFIITFLAIPIVLQIAEEKKLFDVPDERKIHKVPVPSLGGVGIFGGFLLASLLSISAYQNQEFQYFFAYSLFSFSMAVSLLAFLIFNHHPAKIFMGDSGSLMIGLLNSILAIKFINVADSSSIAFPIESCVVIGMAILIVPLIDTLRVFS